MNRPATDPLKFDPPRGVMAVLQYAPPAMLRIDPDYQRTIDNGASRSLIRRIAQRWDWALCQPLVVSRRGAGDDHDPAMFVIDGQHRLAAARLRGDIHQLPCVVVEFASIADEAASFVHLNQQRRSLSKIDLFKAAVASGDSEATAIAAALSDAGLTVAAHSNHTGWQAGQLINIGGIEAAWRQRGPSVTAEAIFVLAAAFAGEVLRYAGTIFPGIAAVVHRGVDYDRAKLVEILKRRSQVEWRNELFAYVGAHPETKKRDGIGLVLMAEWRGQPLGSTEDQAPLAVRGDGEGKAWCKQCDRRVTIAFGEMCRSRFCSLRSAAQ